MGPPGPPNKGHIVKHPLIHTPTLGADAKNYLFKSICVIIEYFHFCFLESKLKKSLFKKKDRGLFHFSQKLSIFFPTYTPRPKIPQSLPPKTAACPHTHIPKQKAMSFFKPRLVPNILQPQGDKTTAVLVAIFCVLAFSHKKGPFGCFWHITFDNKKMLEYLVGDDLS